MPTRPTGSLSTQIMTRDTEAARSSRRVRSLIRILAIALLGLALLIAVS